MSDRRICVKEVIMMDRIPMNVRRIGRGQRLYGAP